MELFLKAINGNTEIACEKWLREMGNKAMNVLNAVQRIREYNMKYEISNFRRISQLFLQRTLFSQNKYTNI